MGGGIGDSNQKRHPKASHTHLLPSILLRQVVEHVERHGGAVRGRVMAVEERVLQVGQEARVEGVLVDALVAGLALHEAYLRPVELRHDRKRRKICNGQLRQIVEDKVFIARHMGNKARTGAMDGSSARSKVFVRLFLRYTR